MMHLGVPRASPEAGVFVRALAVGARTPVPIKRAAPAAVRPLAAAVHTQSSV